MSTSAAPVVRRKKSYTSGAKVKPSFWAGVRDLDADQVQPSVETDDTSQRQKIRDWIEAKGLVHKFDMLPPDNDWTFVDIGETRVKDQYTAEKKLFLGQRDADPEEGGGEVIQTWAQLQIHPNIDGNSRVSIINEDIHVGTKEIVTNTEDMNLMYPFKTFQVLRERNEKRRGEKLRALIRYLFLECGHAEHVFSASSDRPYKSLQTAISQIQQCYVAKGGVHRVPNLERPRDAPLRRRMKPNATRGIETRTANHNTTGEGPTGQRVKQQGPRGNAGRAIRQWESEPDLRPKQVVASSTRVATQHPRPKPSLQPPTQTPSEFMTGAMLEMSLTPAPVLNTNRKRPAESENFLEALNRLEAEQKRKKEMEKRLQEDVNKQISHLRKLQSELESVKKRRVSLEDEVKQRAAKVEDEVQSCLAAVSREEIVRKLLRPTVSGGAQHGT
ncbi:hypothetical protein K458DRAFT_391286 [Lentithecium fluviatile CBS 122367]|uniref:Uncharacterized protein n=1 Tax=Lentithecium fluviatile CBS 122367 TaxID=1168545 RepID=A0A6G1IWF1_9PLEO|nr:hypothetical protein K458DRAFT_391286 [Lentithecium fluviatile CBS 122367]